MAKKALLFTRVIVVGSTRRVDAALADGEPVCGLLPDVARLLGENTEGSWALVTSVGERVPDDLSLAEAGVLDGEVLRLVAEEDVPPPVAVTDVTDRIGERIEGLPVWRRWGKSQTMVVGFLIITLLVWPLLLNSILGKTGSSRAADGWPWVGVMAAIVVVVGTWLARRKQTWWAIACLAVGFGVAIRAGLDLAAWAESVGHGLTGSSMALSIMFAVVVAAVPVAAIVGIGWRRISVVLAFAAVLVLGGGFVVCNLAGVDVQHTVALLGAVAVFGLGLAPAWSLQTSGLTGMDDLGQAMPQEQVDKAADAALGSMDWLGVVLGVVASVSAAYLVARPLSGSRWLFSLGVALALVVWMRSRVFPTWPPTAVMRVGVMGTVVAGLLAHPLGEAWQWAAWAVLLAVIIVGVGVRPARHVQAWWRKVGNAVEMIAVIAVVPLMLGAFGVYSKILVGLT